MHLETQAVHLHSEYVRLSSAIDTSLATLCARPEVFACVEALRASAYQLTLLQADAKPAGGARYSVVTDQITLRDVLDSCSPAKGHVDRVALRALYLRLRPLAHTDTASTTPAVTLAQLRQAYETESLALLHLYSMALKSPDADWSTSAVGKTVSFLQRRLLMLRATQCYGVLSAHIARGPTKAAAELMRIIYIQQHVIDAALANARPSHEESRNAAPVI